MERNPEGRSIDAVVLIVVLLMLFALVTITNVQLDRVSVQVNDLQTRVHTLEQGK